MAREAPVGNVAMVPEGLQPCLGQRTLLIRPDKKKVNSRYLAYLLIGPQIQGIIHSKTNGATVSHLNMKDVRELELSELPPLPRQCRIADILSAYDDLIENNRRRIKILEEMARSLYREWFVYFRYPGHEGVPLVDSPLGRIPKGWKKTKFEEILTSSAGGDWGSEQQTGDDSSEVLVVRGTDFDEVAYGGNLRSPIRFINPKSLKTRRLMLGDVIVENSINAKSRCVGTPLIVDEQVLNRLGRDSIAASFCKVFRFNDVLLAPLAYWHIRHLREIHRMEFYQNVATNGIANFQTQKFVSEECLVLPEKEGLRKSVLEPFSEINLQVSLLASQISNLRQTRDLLLPRLLSGQITLDEKATAV
jgi:type I restriction enzyme S subunit